MYIFELKMVSVDENAFITRVEKLYQDWEVRKTPNIRSLSSVLLISYVLDIIQSMDDENDLWDETDCLAVIVGKDEVLYAKSTAFQVIIRHSTVIMGLQLE